MCLPSGSVVKNHPVNVGDIGDMGLIHRVGNGNPLQYSHLGNPMDRGTRQATMHGVAPSRHNLETKQQQITAASSPDQLISPSEFTNAYMTAYYFPRENEKGIALT